MSEIEPQHKEERGARFPEIAAALDAMAAEDQTMRARSQESGGLLDDSVDQRNTETLKGIISKIGWPTRSKVGETAALNAWLLAQHADHDPAFQAECLSLMKQESGDEVSRRKLAYLEDRVRIKLGQPQLYGTQFFQEKDAVGKVILSEPFPIEDEANVDTRRAAAGLEPLAEYRRQMHALHPHLLEESDTN